MSREIIQIARFGALSATSQGPMDARIANFRDALRNRLDVNSWGIGDIVKWQGYTNHYFGYSFGVYARNGSGVNTGPGWVFVFCTGPSNQTPIGYRAVSNNTQNPTPAIPQIRNINNNDKPPAALLFGFQEDAGTGNDWNFGYTHSNGVHPTLAGGDFSQPPVNLFQNIAGFMPQDYYKIMGGYSTNNGMFAFHPNNTTKVAGMVLVLDSAAPFIAMYATAHFQDNYPSYMHIAGNIVDTYDPQDSGYYAHLAAIISDINELWDVYGNWKYIYLQARNLSGDVEAFNLVWDESFAPGNSPMPNGEYPWKPIGIVNDDYYKGRFKPEIIRQVGWEYGQYGQIFKGADQAQIKINQRAVMPWKNGVPSIYGGLISDDIIVV